MRSALPVQRLPNTEPLGFLPDEGLESRDLTRQAPLLRDLHEIGLPLPGHPPAYGDLRLGQFVVHAEMITRNPSAFACKPHAMILLYAHMAMVDPTVIFHDARPDSLGRRQFSLTWSDPDGVFRPEIHPDGAPVGYRRGQVFFAVPENFVPAGAVVIEGAV